MARPKRITTRSEDKTCVLYARVSTKEQQEEGYSIEAQLELLRLYARTEGLRIVEEFIEAESASKTGRPAFARMLRAVREGRAESIIVEKTDRLTRSIRDYSTLQEVIDGGVQVHCVKEHEVYSRESKSHAKFVFGIKVCVAELYSNNLSEEVLKGMNQKASEGLWPSQAPFGYLNTLENGRRVIVPDPERAGLVSRLFALYASGAHSMKDCAKVAADVGMRGKRGGRMNPSSVQIILTNPVYIGRVRWNGTETDGKHDPIVDHETWNRVQAVMAGRAAKTSTVESPDYVFKGLLRCGVCGCAVTPYTVKGRYTYYACTGYKGCKRTPTREDDLVEQVAQVLDGVSLRPDTVELVQSVLREAWASLKETEGPRRESMERRAKALEDKLERLYLDNLSGKVPESSYSRLKDQWEAELADARKQADAVADSGRRTLDDLATTVRGLSNCAEVFRTADTSVRREMFRAMVSNSTLADGIIAVTLRDWFKLVYEANARSAEETEESHQRAVWWA